MAPKRIVLDVEIQKTFEEVGGDHETGKMGVGVAVVWFCQQGRFQIFGEEHLEELRAIILGADEVGGFNIWNFDLPVIFGLSRSEFMASEIAERIAPTVYDVFRLICERLPGRGWGLDNVSRGTLGHAAHGGKTGKAADAPQLFKDGKLFELANYCMADVALERDVIAFAKRHGYVLNHLGHRRPVSPRDSALLAFKREAAIA